MTNGKLLARAEKAEKELAEFKSQTEKAAKELFHQQEESWLVVKAMFARIRQLEAQIKELKP
jgi:hypothetical protein